MAHDPLFEQRIANELEAHGAKAEPKRMFGGVAFMVRGHMTVGITNKGDFMVRFDGTRHAEVAQWPGAKPMTFGKGDMKGFLFVDEAAVGKKAPLERWVKLSLSYNATLPAKKPKPAATKKAPSKPRVVRKKK